MVGEIGKAGEIGKTLKTANFVYKEVFTYPFISHIYFSCHSMHVESFDTYFILQKKTHIDFQNRLF